MVNVAADTYFARSWCRKAVVRRFSALMQQPRRSMPVETETESNRKSSLWYPTIPGGAVALFALYWLMATPFKRPLLYVKSAIADRTATQYDRLLASSCCPSVCPSVCLWRCALWLSGLVYAAKSCTSVFLAGMFLFVPSDTFAVGCIV